MTRAGTRQLPARDSVPPAIALQLDWVFILYSPLSVPCKQFQQEIPFSQNYFRFLCGFNTGQGNLLKIIPTIVYHSNCEG